MADETIELTQVQAVIAGLSSPTDEQFMQALRGYSDTAVALAGAKGGPGGGSLPSWWTVGATDTFTMTPTDQTSDSPFLNMICDYTELIDVSNFGYVINIREVGSTIGDDTELFGVSVNRMVFRSAPNEGQTSFIVESSDLDGRSLVRAGDLSLYADTTNPTGALTTIAADQLRFFDAAVEGAAPQQVLVRPAGDAGALWDVLNAYGLVVAA